VVIRATPIAIASPFVVISTTCTKFTAHHATGSPAHLQSSHPVGARRLLNRHAPSVLTTMARNPGYEYDFFFFFEEKVFTGQGHAETNLD
jgi:hypothetical protein